MPDVPLYSLTPQPIAGLRKAGAVGDSIFGDAIESGHWTNWGTLAWLRRFLSDRIDLPQSRVFATSGHTIAQARTIQLPLALAANLDICLVHIGTNSLLSPLATNLADLQAIYDGLLANGTFIVAIPIRARNSPLALSGDTLLNMAAINRFIAEYARANPGMLVVDVNPSFLDFSTGNVKAAYLRDGVHDNLISAKAMGRLVADAVSGVIPAWDDRFTHLGDVYDATKNPRGSLLLNGLMAGTGGSAISGASGNVATSWYIVGGGGTITAAGSKTSHATFTGLDKQRITFGGIGDGSTVLFSQDRSIASSGLSVGDVVQASVELDYNLSAGFAGLALAIFPLNSSFTPIGDTRDGYHFAGNGVMAAEATTSPLLLRTDPITLPVGTAHVRTSIMAIGPSSGAVSAWIEATRASLRKVL